MREREPPKTFNIKEPQNFFGYKWETEEVRENIGNNFMEKKKTKEQFFAWKFLQSDTCLAHREDK